MDGTVGTMVALFVVIYFFFKCEVGSVLFAVFLPLSLIAGLVPADTLFDTISLSLFSLSFYSL